MCCRFIGVAKVSREWNIKLNDQNEDCNSRLCCCRLSCRRRTILPRRFRRTVEVLQTELLRKTEDGRPEFSSFQDAHQQKSNLIRNNVRKQLLLLVFRSCRMSSLNPNRSRAIPPLATEAKRFLVRSTN